MILLLVEVVAVNRIDDYFAVQEQQNLESRASAVGNILRVFVEREAGSDPVVSRTDRVDPDVVSLLSNEAFVGALARIGGADLELRLGREAVRTATGERRLVPGSAGPWTARYEGAPLAGQTRQAISRTFIVEIDAADEPWAMAITLSGPYSYRTTSIADLTLVLAIVALVALALAFLLGGLIARRSATSLRRLTEASRVIAEGDLTARVPTDEGEPVEFRSLSRQFNRMAAQLEESVEFIRRDRDRSRDFLADVSHELRTPIAALRTFNELLREGAAADPATRDEFLEASAGQLERLDWLALNLLELSKLDSGLVLLDLRPDDLRTSVESAVEQAEAVAARRGIELTMTLPERPVRIRHDPQRIAQVVANLVSNGLKFTPRGGSVRVELEAQRDGARIRVTDTGVGIDAAELPRIFERFYRGSRANEARGSGSGLGLAIARSIVEMHEGRIAVASQLGEGATFTVFLPKDPRAVSEARREGGA
ncbi:MAG: hypothetical protein RL338_389 [Chloroflexota bacterium]